MVRLVTLDDSTADCYLHCWFSGCFVNEYIEFPTNVPPDRHESFDYKISQAENARLPQKT